MEKVVGEQYLALQQHFTQMSSKFSEILNSLLEGASNFGTLVFSICSLHTASSIHNFPTTERVHRLCDGKNSFKTDRRVSSLNSWKIA